MGRRAVRKRGKEITRELHARVEISALAAGGSCVGTITSITSADEAPSNSPLPPSLIGKKIFIPYTVPGEIVTAKITSDQKSFCEGELVAIEAASKERIQPICPHFGECGGCNLQHINLPHQREVKRQMVERELLKNGIQPNHGVTLLAPHLDGIAYRRRMSFHLNKKGEFGLYKRSARQIVPLSACPIATDTINQCLKLHLPLIIGCGPEAETVTFEDHDGEIYLAFEVHPRAREAVDSLVEKDAFKELCREIKNVQINYRHRPAFLLRAGVRDTSAEPPIGHFSQNNALANIEMIEEIAGAVRTEGVTDLYAGAGNISLPLAMRGHRVHAVEVDAHLVDFGRKRAESQGLAARVEFVQQTCEKWIEHGSPDPTVVLDPPRGGAFEVAKRLSPSVTPSVIYVSCYPPTFVRDCVELIQRGYRCISVKVLDMFPQTYHAEIVAEFQSA